ncbi:MAG: sugar phosphate nucleotidyltransferase [Pseudobdellovibrionaceae bacterium]
MITKSPAEADGSSPIKLDIFLLMAGQGLRFANAGYKIKKPFIMIKNHQIFLHALASFEAVIRAGARLFLVVQKEDLEAAKLAIKSLRLPYLKFIILNEPTSGPVASALNAIAELPIEDQFERSIIVHDCDVAYNFDFSKMLEAKSEIRLLTFQSSSPAYSYLKSSSITGYVEAIAEKKVISNEAVIGCYFFETKNLFLNLAKSAFMNHSNGECFLSDVVKLGLMQNRKISSFPALQYWGMGTPEELIETKNNPEFATFFDAKLQEML